MPSFQLTVWELDAAVAARRASAAPMGPSRSLAILGALAGYVARAAGRVEAWAAGPAPLESAAAR